MKYLLNIQYLLLIIAFVLGVCILFNNDFFILLLIFAFFTGIIQVFSALFLLFKIHRKHHLHYYLGLVVIYFLVIFLCLPLLNLKENIVFIGFGCIATALMIYFTFTIYHLKNNSDFMTNIDSEVLDM